MIEDINEWIQLNKQELNEDIITFQSFSLEKVDEDIQNEIPVDYSVESKFDLNNSKLEARVFSSHPNGFDPDMSEEKFNIKKGTFESIQFPF